MSEKLRIIKLNSSTDAMNRVSTTTFCRDAIHRVSTTTFCTDAIHRIS